MAQYVCEDCGAALAVDDEEGPECRGNPGAAGEEDGEELETDGDDEREEVDDGGVSYGSSGVGPARLVWLVR